MQSILVNRMPYIRVEYACELVQGGVQTIDRKLLGAKIISTLLQDDIPITYIYHIYDIYLQDEIDR